MKQFSKTVLYFFFLWVICLCGVFGSVIYYPLLKENSSKYATYRSPKVPKTPESIFQNREGVSKDLWITSKEGRIHCHLESPSSHLQFIKTGTNQSLIETLSQLKMWIQESENKDIRYLRASSGDFNYHSHSLHAQEAFLSSYKINHPESLIFSCIAKDLTLSFNDSPLAFSASGFSAHLQSSRPL